MAESESSPGAPHAIEKVGKLKLSFAERIAVTYVTKPVAMFCSMWVAVVVISLFVFSQGWLTVAQIATRDWLLVDELETERFDAVNNAVQVAVEDLTDGIQYAPRSRTLKNTGFEMILEWEDGRNENIMTRENVQKLCSHGTSV